MSSAVPIATPETVVRAVFDALEADDWRSVAALTHPDALAAFRRERLAVLDAERVASSVRESSVPAPVSTYLHDLREGAEAVQGFARVRSRAELERLAPEELLARWLEAHAAPTAPSGRSIVGAVAEGDELAHVVYRAAGALAVLSTRRSGARWLILPNADLLATPSAS